MTTKAETAEEIAKIAAAAAAAVIANDIHHIQIDLTEIKHNLETSYLTKIEFDPVRKIVYGLVGIILIVVVGALVALVVIQK